MIEIFVRGRGSSGPSIVKDLKRYGKVQIDFLAHIENKLPSELESDLRRLEEAGVVHLEGKMVSLQKSA